MGGVRDHDLARLREPYVSIWRSSNVDHHTSQKTLSRS
jgi:hypothetical protein